MYSFSKNWAIQADTGDVVNGIGVADGLLLRYLILKGAVRAEPYNSGLGDSVYFSYDLSEGEAIPIEANPYFQGKYTQGHARIIPKRQMQIYHPVNDTERVYSAMSHWQDPWFEIGKKTVFPQNFSSRNQLGAAWAVTTPFSMHRAEYQIKKTKNHINHFRQSYEYNLQS